LPLEIEVIFIVQQEREGFRHHSNKTWVKGERPEVTRELGGQREEELHLLAFDCDQVGVESGKEGRKEQPEQRTRDEVRGMKQI
jgi:hypothetical protein